MTDETKKAIEQARRYLDNHDNHMAAFVLLDLDDTKYLGLTSLAWAMDKSSSLHRNDVEFLIELLEGNGATEAG